MCRYPDIWYEDITSNPKFYSLAATFDTRIIGFLVAEIKSLCKTNKEVTVHVIVIVKFIVDCY